jgi:hypothetical protein
VLAASLERGNLVVAELLDGTCAVNVGAVGTGTEDGTDQRRTVLV